MFISRRPRTKKRLLANLPDDLAHSKGRGRAEIHDVRAVQPLGVGDRVIKGHVHPASEIEWRGLDPVAAPPVFFPVDAGIIELEESLDRQLRVGHDLGVAIECPLVEIRDACRRDRGVCLVRIVRTPLEPVVGIRHGQFAGSASKRRFHEHRAGSVSIVHATTILGTGKFISNTRLFIWRKGIHLTATAPDAPSPFVSHHHVRVEAGHKIGRKACIRRAVNG